MLLQLLDDGRVTDSHGRTVSFRNTVVIMTSNIGSHNLLEGVTDSGEIREGARKQVLDEMRAHFRPEFLNRVDDIVLFKPLQLAEIEQIVELMVNELRQRLEDRSVTLEMTPAARDRVAREGFDPVYGARPLKRVIQRLVQDPLAMRILEGEFPEGSKVAVDTDGDALTFHKA